MTVSAVAFALRSVVDPTLPATAGTMAPVTVRTEPGTIVDARYPAAVGAGNVEVSQRVADVCAGRSRPAVPRPGRRGVAGDDEQRARRRRGPDGHWVYYETVGGGQGGRPPRPGAPGAGRCRA